MFNGFNGFFKCGFITSNGSRNLTRNLIISLVSRMIPPTTCKERELAIEKAGYNLFNLPSKLVSGGDYLSDSGTGGLLDTQRSAMELADESYAGSASYERFEDRYKILTGFKHILPVHQGRAAEKILFSILRENSVVFSNSLFDTTRAHIENVGAMGIDLIIPQALNIGEYYPFKGNINIDELKKQIPLAIEQGKIVDACVITVTNNTGGGQPVSLYNIKEAKQVLEQYGIPLIIDACRIAENAYFIKCRERGYETKKIEEIVQEIFSYADAFTMSAKKDGIANMGGVLGFNNDEWADILKPAVILYEGFLNYGGMSGRDMMAVAEGLKVSMTEQYLKSRIEDTKYFGDSLKKYGIPIIEPTGGHAVYVDAGKILPHIPAQEFPGQALACAAYIVGGIRSCEMGSVMFGRYDDKENPKNLTTPHKHELVRFAIPRLTYNREAFDFVALTLRKIAENPSLIPPMEFDIKPAVLPHFSATFKPKSPFGFSLETLINSKDKSCESTRNSNCYGPF